jgi:hypothetical protein
MKLFGAEDHGAGSGRSASAAGRLHMRAWDQELALRISLQKPLDICNMFPVSEAGRYDCGSASDELRNVLSDLSELIDLQDHGSSNKKKRKLDFSAASEDAVWEHLLQTQKQLQERWEPVVDKWHARLNYGSEKSKLKLKVLSTSVWDQINRVLEDESVVIDKSRSLMSASKRIKRLPEDEIPAVGVRDEEVYDDAHFYSVLLKVCKQSANK